MDRYTLDIHKFSAAQFRNQTHAELQYCRTRVEVLQNKRDGSCTHDVKYGAPRATLFPWGRGAVVSVGIIGECNSILNAHRLLLLLLKSRDN